MKSLMCLLCVLGYAASAAAVGVGPKQAEAFTSHTEQVVKNLEAYQAGYEQALKCVTEKGSVEACQNWLESISKDAKQVESSGTKAEFSK